uniref:Uncharacterized protein n=1 Tax=Thermomicrobium roseum TaxID=500 RepID=A0A7C5VW63_THERO
MRLSWGITTWLSRATPVARATGGGVLLVRLGVGIFAATLEAIFARQARISEAQAALLRPLAWTTGTCTWSTLRRGISWPLFGFRTGMVVIV